MWFTSVSWIYLNRFSRKKRYFQNLLYVGTDILMAITLTTIEIKTSWTCLKIFSCNHLFNCYNWPKFLNLKVWRSFLLLLISAFFHLRPMWHCNPLYPNHRREPKLWVRFGFHVRLTLLALSLHCNEDRYQRQIQWKWKIPLWKLLDLRHHFSLLKNSKYEITKYIARKNLRFRSRAWNQDIELFLCLGTHKR